MACKTVSVSVIYDLHGKQTGEFEFKCEGTCDDGRPCDWVEYDNRRKKRFERYCGCPTVREGRVIRDTNNPPPGKGERCGNIFLFEEYADDGEKFELTPFCQGACDDGECKKKETVHRETIESASSRPRRVTVKTYSCECK